MEEVERRNGCKKVGANGNKGVKKAEMRGHLTEGKRSQHKGVC